MATTGRCAASAASSCHAVHDGEARSRVPVVVALHHTEWTGAWTGRGVSAVARRTRGIVPTASARVES